jgi:hypothetical protein
MHEPRSGAGAASIDNHIFIVGGYDGKSQLSSVEKYNVLTNQWTYVSSISSPRSAMGCLATRKGVVIICGGYDGHNFLNESETYDPKEDVWRKHCGIFDFVAFCTLYAFLKNSVFNLIDLTSRRSGHGMVITVGFPPQT